MKALENIIDNALEATDKVKKLNIKVAQTEEQSRWERLRITRLERQNKELIELVAMKEGKAIFDLAANELKLALTDELRDILTNIRERIALEFRSDVRIDIPPGTDRQLLFTLTVPPITLHFNHLICMRDAAEYYRLPL